MPGAHDALEGAEHVDKIIEIDQSPIGRTPRSNPATYIGLFTPIRELFAGVPESRVRGYAPGRFSFNVKGGRCEHCKGDGILKIEMQFLPDVYVPCEVCKGKRYNREALEIHYRGQSIADVLEMTIEEALDVFSAVPKVATKLQTMVDVGLGYVHLGQPATTLSGGEAQRVKLSTELSRRATGRTLYVLDEPTTGLHFADVEKLLEVLHRLVDARQHGRRHRAQPRRHQDGRLDRRPRARGRDRGGRIVAEGTPEEVAAAGARPPGSTWPASCAASRSCPLSDVTFAEELGREVARTAAETGEAIPPARAARGRRPSASRRRLGAGGAGSASRAGQHAAMPDIDFAFLADAAEARPGEKFHVLGGGVSPRGVAHVPVPPSAPGARHRPLGHRARDGPRARGPVRPPRPGRPRARRRERGGAASPPPDARDSVLTFAIDLWNVGFDGPATTRSGSSSTGRSGSGCRSSWTDSPAELDSTVN